MKVMENDLQTRIIAMTLLIALTMPIQLAAQDASAQAKKAQHHHYKLIDMGTFGGSASCINEAVLSTPAINGKGATVGTSATTALQTSTSNPVAIDCGNGPNIFHAFEWHHGSLTDLGTLAGPDFNSVADSINEKGVIDGVSENGLVDPAVGFNQVRAVIWKHGEIQDLGTFGGLHSWSFGIDNNGQVIGMALNTVPDPVSMYGFLILGSSTSTQTRAFLWQHGVMQDLGTLGGPDAWAWAINESGQVLGWSYTNATPNPSSGFPTLDAFFWEHGKMQPIGSFGGVVGFPVALNNRGQAIGGSSTAASPAACWVPSRQSVEFGDPNCHPFLWNAGKLIDLNTSTIGANPRTSDAINDAGEIVGAAAFPTQPYDAYLWSDGVATDLGHLLGDCGSEAFAVNLKGQAVGNSFGCSIFQHHAFLWENGSIVDLNSLIPKDSSLQLVFANAINERGEIAGNGVPPGVSPRHVFDLGHAFLLVPCDENHPDVEGCDYSLGEAATAAGASEAPAMQDSTTANQTNPASHGAINPMLRRFGGRLMPAYRDRGAQTPTSAPIGQPALSEIDLLLEPGFCFRNCHPGHCEVDDSTGNLLLNGFCFAHNNPLSCNVYRSTQCPKGKQAIQDGFDFCRGLSQIRIDPARKC